MECNTNLLLVLKNDHLDSKLKVMLFVYDKKYLFKKGYFGILK
jgi:hypothetical protein